MVIASRFTDTVTDLAIRTARSAFPIFYSIAVTKVISASLDEALSVADTIATLSKGAAWCAFVVHLAITSVVYSLGSVALGVALSVVELGFAWVSI